MITELHKVRAAVVQTWRAWNCCVTGVVYCVPWRLRMLRRKVRECGNWRWVGCPTSWVRCNVPGRATYTGLYGAWYRFRLWRYNRRIAKR
jgi:hypothetical protein